MLSPLGGDGGEKDGDIIWFSALDSMNAGGAGVFGERREISRVKGQRARARSQRVCRPSHALLVIRVLKSNQEKHHHRVT